MSSMTMLDHDSPFNLEQVHAKDIHQWGQRNCYLTSHYVLDLLKYTNSYVNSKTFSFELEHDVTVFLLFTNK